MLARLQKWFDSPVFADNIDKTRTALILNTFLNMFLVALPALFLNIVLSKNIPRPGIQLSTIFCLWLSILWLKNILHSGRVDLSGITLVILMLAGTTLIIYNIGSIRTPVSSFYLLAIIISGLSIDRRTLIVTAIITGVIVISLAMAEMNGLLPEPDLTVSLTQVVTLLTLIVLIAYLEFIKIKSADESLARARQELTERMLTKETEISRRIMMEKVIQIGKTVTEQTSDFRTALFRIWDGVRNGLDFDRTAIFLYNPMNNMMQGSYGTNRSGNLSEEWDMKFGIDENNSFFRIVLNQPDGYYFTQDYAGERNLSQRPGHPMGGVKYYAAVGVWAGNKPAAIICVDQLTSGRIISDEQLEALRLFAGYAGLAIENARLNSELEDRMQERENFIKELGNRNAELERFTYTVSHDLRSPLVTIKGFLGILKKDLSEDHIERVTSDMQRIASATDKMDILLSDLLELSRIGRIVNPPEEIDLVKLAYATLETIDGRLRAKNITTRVSSQLPILYADRIRMGEVLENLIDNAAKYMGDQPTPLIEIGSHNDNGQQVIYVRDNGMGIEPQYLQKVFDLFEKLNPTSEGTGIGLALIKRIVEVHGGKIWVESEGPGKGSTFCFTIPDSRISQ